MTNDDLELEAIIDEGRKQAGRPKLERNYSPAMLLKLYVTYKTVQACAKVLKVTKTTMFRLFKEAGIDINKISKEYLATSKEVLVGTHLKGKVALYLREHNIKEVPLSPSALANMVGCNINTATVFLYRQRKFITDRLKKLPDFRRVKLLFKTNDNKETYSNTWISYKFHVSKRSFNTCILASLPDGEVVIPLPSLQVFEAHLGQLFASLEQSQFDYLFEVQK